MSQAERNVLQSTCSCGTSVQKGSVVHRTSYELLEKGPGPPPPSRAQLGACSAVQRSQGEEMLLMLTAVTKVYVLCYQGIDYLV